MATFCCSTTLITLSSGVLLPVGPSKLRVTNGENITFETAKEARHRVDDRIQLHLADIFYTLLQTPIQLSRVELKLLFGFFG